jgi:hydrogenase 3 maturation protease
MNDYTRNRKQDKSISQTNRLEQELRSFLLREDRIVLVGLGNEFRTDDGVGIATIRHLQKLRLDENLQITLIEAGRNIVNHLHDIGKVKPSKIVFIDAADIQGQGGDLRILYKDQLAERIFSTHENNLNLTLNYLKEIVPDCQVLFLGIQYTSLEMSEKLSLTKEVQKEVEQVSAVIKHVIETL